MSQQLIQSILEQDKPELSSMQVFDSMALSVKNSNQIRSLASLLLTYCKLSFTLQIYAVASKPLYYAGVQIATYACARNNDAFICTIDFNDIPAESVELGFPRSIDLYKVSVNGDDIMADYDNGILTFGTSSNIVDITII